jgi:hypothetical protein
MAGLVKLAFYLQNRRNLARLTLAGIAAYYGRCGLNHAASETV